MIRNGTCCWIIFALADRLYISLGQDRESSTAVLHGYVGFRAHALPTFKPGKCLYIIYTPVSFRMSLVR